MKTISQLHIDRLPGIFEGEGKISIRQELNTLSELSKQLTEQLFSGNLSEELKSLVEDQLSNCDRIHEILLED
jgi:hypothetical protein